MAAVSARRREPATRAELLDEWNRRVSIQPPLELLDRDEFPAAPSDPTELWPDVLVEEVPTAAQGRCCLIRRKRETEVRGIAHGRE